MGTEEGWRVEMSGTNSGMRIAFMVKDEELKDTLHWVSNKGAVRLAYILFSSCRSEKRIEDSRGAVELRALIFRLLL